MFGFGKKKKEASQTSEKPASISVDAFVAEAQEETSNLDGPYDENDGALRELLDPEDTGVGIADFGAYAFAAPEDAQIQIETTEDGLFDCHILVGDGRITMSAYAAPKSGGQWRLVASELAEALRSQGAQVSIQDGPWGREVVGKAPQSLIRFIGTDGPRWMLRSVVVSTPDNAEEVAHIARNIFRKTVVRRGRDPMPARTPIALELPNEVQQQVQAAQQEAWEQQRIEMERQRLRENS
ncbi:MAG: DUF3710 domain-containing protein [Lawsonella sp.]